MSTYTKISRGFNFIINQLAAFIIFPLNIRGSFIPVVVRWNVKDQYDKNRKAKEEKM